MANSFVTLRDIARTALPHLMNNLVFPRLIHSDFDDALAAKLGEARAAGAEKVRRANAKIEEQFNA